MGEDLQKSEARWRTLFENTGAAAAIIEDDGTISRVNEEFARLFGYSKEEVEGKKRWTELACPEDREGMEEFHLLQRKQPEKAPRTAEFRGLDKEGRAREIFLTIALLPGTQGGIASLQDLTKQKKAMKFFQEIEARYQAMMDQSPDGICLADTQTKQVSEANISLTQMLGYAREEILKLSLYDFMALDREEVDQRIRELTEGKKPCTIERQYRRQDGSLLDVWVSASIVSYGHRDMICLIARDLTEKKALEAQFLLAQRMGSMGMLARGISHDLNNVLTPILINAELLTEILLDEESHTMASSILAAAQRGMDIAQQIMAFSRGMEGELPAFSPKYLLKEIDYFIRESFPPSITIETEIPRDVWPIMGDVAQIHQVLLNLCHNAMDAMPSGGSMTLSVRNFNADEAYVRMYPEAKAQPYVVFSVKDTGTGIPPDILDKIFDPFFTTKGEGRAKGLGLATVRSIVKNHGGFIRVYSESNRETRFLVFLPAYPPTELEMAGPPSPSGKGELILVVEDEISIREIIQITLQAFGYQVMPASDGAEAITLYAQYPGKIDVVLADIDIPTLEGPSILQALQEMNPQAKVIVTSRKDADRPMIEVNFPIVKAFLWKPFTAYRLLEAVGGLVGAAKED